MHLNFQTTTKWTCCSNADFKELYDAGWADCLAECTDTPTTPTPTGPTTPTQGPGPTTTKGPAPDCQKVDGPSGTVKSPGFPDPPNDMDESCWKIRCDGEKKMLYVKSEVAYELAYNCDGETTSEECEDKWSQKKCKKCNAKKCKKDKKCKKNCQNTCDLCDNRILAPFY